MSQPPYAPPPAPQQAEPPYYVQPQVPTSGLAIAALIVSLVGFLICALPTGLVGAIMGLVARSQVARSGGAQRGKGLALAAILTGAAQVVVFAGVVVVAVVALRAAGSTGGLSAVNTDSCRIALKDSDVQLVFQGQGVGIGCTTAKALFGSDALSTPTGELPPNVACNLHYTGSRATYEVRYANDQELANKICDQLRSEGYKG